MTKAAEKGHKQAQFNVGYCYYKGDGVGMDRFKAVKWYLKAAGKYHS